MSVNRYNLLNSVTYKYIVDNEKANDVSCSNYSTIRLTSHEHHGFMNHRQSHYFFNRLFRLTAKKTLNHNIAGHRWTSIYSSHAESVSKSRRHHDYVSTCDKIGRCVICNIIRRKVDRIFIRLLAKRVAIRHKRAAAKTYSSSWETCLLEMHLYIHIYINTLTRTRAC